MFRFRLHDYQNPYGPLFLNSTDRPKCDLGFPQQGMGLRHTTIINYYYNKKSSTFDTL